MKKWIFVLTLLILFCLSSFFLTQEERNKRETFNIGIITDLSGPAAYWGGSTQQGMQLAVQDLAAEDIAVELIFEDYQLEARKAASAAQKLIHVDQVDALYSEFNPGAVSVQSAIGAEEMLHIYAASIESPLAESTYTYKTYLDYRAGCRALAEQLQEKSIERIGFLEVRLEFGMLCREGLELVFDDVLAESYQLGETDFRTAVQKMKSQGVEAIVNVGFEGETLATLSAMTALDYAVPYATVADTLTDAVKEQYSQQEMIAFGFQLVDESFTSRFMEAPASLDAAALGYLHLYQIGKVLSVCDKDIACMAELVVASSDDKSGIGFQGFQDRRAMFTEKIFN